MISETFHDIPKTTEVYQVTNGHPKSVASFLCTEHGILYRVRTPRERSLHKSRGRHAPPGRLGKPTTGQREAGILASQSAGGTRMSNAERTLLAMRKKYTLEYWRAAMR